MNKVKMHCQASFVIITCEHGGNKIPPELSPLFKGKKEILKSHRGWDPGALGTAKKISTSLNVPLIYEEISRLVVEQNRSRQNSSVFSEYMSPLSKEEKLELLENVYDPYHRKIFKTIKDAVSRGKRVLHFSIHSFTPVLNGDVRNADMGLLYDPSRTGEKEVCLYLQEFLVNQVNGIRVRRNYPYLGISDGLTKQMRKMFKGDRYLGIEIEINQKHYLQETGMRNRIEESLIMSIEALTDR